MARRILFPAFLALAALGCATKSLPDGAKTFPCDVELPDGSKAVSVRVPPLYPEAAIQSGTTGSVTTTFDIDLYGRTENLEISKSDPPGVFDAAAKNAIRQWVYCPGSARQEGVTVKLNFNLGS